MVKMRYFNIIIKLKTQSEKLKNTIYNSKFMNIMKYALILLFILIFPFTVQAQNANGNLNTNANASDTLNVNFSQTTNFNLSAGLSPESKLYFLKKWKEG